MLTEYTITVPSQLTHTDVHTVTLTLPKYQVTQTSDNSSKLVRVSFWLALTSLASSFVCLLITSHVMMRVATLCWHGS